MATRKQVQAEPQKLSVSYSVDDVLENDEANAGDVVVNVSDGDNAVSGLRSARCRGR